MFPFSLKNRLVSYLNLLLLTSILFWPLNAQAKHCDKDTDCPNTHFCLQHRCKRKPTFKIKLPEQIKMKAYDLAIAPVRWFGPAKKYKTTLIRHQIYMQLYNNFSLLVGMFNILKNKGILEKPPYNGIDIGTFSFRPWQQQGASGLIKVGIRAKNEKQLQLLLRFYDVNFNTLSIRQDSLVTQKTMRRTIHQFCNAIYEKLIKKPGLFTTYIAYVQRNLKGGKDIWIMDFDGHNKRRVVSNGALNLLPQWSKDGRFLIFTSYIATRPYLYRLDLKTKLIHRITYIRGTYTGASVAPNNKIIAFSLTKAGKKANAEIYTSTLQGTHYRQLTHAWGIDSSPTWSPDGRYIAFVSERYTTPQIFLMNSDGSHQQRLTYRGNYNQEPRWSPTSSTILFTARDEFLKYDLFLLKLTFRKNSSNVDVKYERLTQNQGNNFEASWSPDGRFIIFVSTRYGERKLMIMNADGSKQRLFLRHRGDFETPAWSPIVKNLQLPNIRNFYKLTRLVYSKKRDLAAAQKYESIINKKPPSLQELLEKQRKIEKIKEEKVLQKAKKTLTKLEETLKRANTLLKGKKSKNSPQKRKKTSAKTPNNVQKNKRAKTQTPSKRKTPKKDLLKRKK